MKTDVQALYEKGILSKTRFFLKNQINRVKMLNQVIGSNYGKRNISEITVAVEKIEREKPDIIDFNK